MPGAHTVVLSLGAAERVRPELERIPEISVVEHYQLSSAREDGVLVRGLAGAWGVVAGSEPYTRGVLEALPDLKAIFRWGRARTRSTSPPPPTPASRSSPRPRSTRRRSRT